MGAEYPQLYLRYRIWCDVETVPGGSAVNISSLANGVFGLHRRHGVSFIAVVAAHTSAAVGTAHTRDSERKSRHCLRGSTRTAAAM